MAKPYIKHTVPAKTKAWLKKEAVTQKALYKSIAKEMNDLAPTRAKWYDEFLHRCQTRGFNVHFTDRRQITDEEIPVQPKGRKDRVIW